MATEFEAVFSRLRSVLVPFAGQLAVKADTPANYLLVTKAPSRFPQHKGEPMYFGSVRLGKAYVSFHLMPLYAAPKLVATISPQLKKRMQGKTCFNFKKVPEAELLTELERLTKAGLDAYAALDWL